MREQLEGKKIQCRLCQGNHFTSRCPHKDTLGHIEEKDDVDADADPALAAATAGTGGKYVPPSMRPGARGAGETMYGRGGNRDDMPTLRVTNLSEDVTEPDLWELFQRFGRVSRIFVGRDQETGMCKGFAFVSFEDKAEAEKAMKKINGLPCAS
jgi:translation initiation factor 3 subunit G